MGLNYIGTQINQSPTITEKAGADIADARGKIVKYDASGNVVLATAGAVAVGITIMEDGANDITGTESGKVASGEDVTVQIKDIGLVKAGGAIAKGDEIASDASGCAVKATDGDFVIGTAKMASASGEYCHIIINKYQKAAKA